MELNIRYFVQVNQSEAHFNALNFVQRKEIAVQNVHPAARPVIRRKRERQLNEIQPGKHLATKIPTQRLTMKPSEGTEKYQALGSQVISTHSAAAAAQNHSRDSNQRIRQEGGLS